MIKKILPYLVLTLFIFVGIKFAAASEVTGNLNPGLDTGIAGVTKAIPSVSPAIGEYHATQSVTLTASGATKICYTTDGSTAPTCASATTCSAGTALASGGTVSVTSSTTIKSVGCYGDGSQGPSGSAAYTLTCSTASLSNGSVSAYPTCGLSCNSGYTLSGSTCVANSSGGGGGGGGTISNPPITAIGSPTITMPMSVSNTQTGNLIQPLSNGSRVELVVPVGAVTARTTFSATTGSLTSNMTPTNTTGALMVGSQVFNITATSNNTAVRNFSGNLSITLTVPSLPDNTANLGVYHFNDTTREWNLVPGAVFDPVNNQVTFQVNHLTKFSVFNIAGLPAVIKTASASTVMTPPVVTPPKPDTSDQVKNIVSEAATIAGRDVQEVLTAVGVMQNTKAEDAAEIKYTNSLVSGLKNITAEIKDAITHFVNYGTPTTLKLGAGERAGVVSSYKSAYAKVPSSETEWSDAIKIGNGRWPSEKSSAAEAKAVVEFKKVYKRAPNMSNANDNAAVTVIAYGLRPTNRNTNSEKAAIKSFKYVYGHDPINALAWDIVRSIAYSGAKR